MLGVGTGHLLSMVVAVDGWGSSLFAHGLWWMLVSGRGHWLMVVGMHAGW